ncbi:MAG: hypothetical protein PUH03_02230 [bacterium]|nr:hypothetical protein [bacterium]MDY2830991.1 hypothetical protein [Alphaproteobacteria bacterium]
MLGAIIGDIVGSRFEFSNIKTKDFQLFDKSCYFTDDSVKIRSLGRNSRRNIIKPKQNKEL